jgi:hypothetical protein
LLPIAEPPWTVDFTIFASQPFSVSVCIHPRRSLSRSLHLSRGLERVTKKRGGRERK